jgi:hypothetical protein
MVGVPPVVAMLIVLPLCKLNVPAALFPIETAPFEVPVLIFVAKFEFSLIDEIAPETIMPPLAVIGVECYI